MGIIVFHSFSVPIAVIPPLPHGYEIVNGKYEPLIRNTATNAIVGPAVEHDNIVSMSEFGMEFAFIVEPEEKHQWTQALKPIKTFSIDQMDSLKEVLKNGTGQLTREELVKSIEKVIDLHSNKDTFAIPSHALMFTLLAMFAGKPKLIPKKLLEKPHSERSPEESAEADRYLASVLEKERALDYSDGTEKVIERYIAIISNNQKVEARADITDTFFKDCINFREASLAMYLKRTFGAEGLRHFLGLIIGLEDNSRKGHFEWHLDEHLERLGYRKKANRSYDIEAKKIASEAVKIFTSFCITSKRKDGKDGINFMKLFNLEAGCIELLDQPIIDKAYITATDSWYKNAFIVKDRQSPQYTKLLRKIVQENHREHPLTLYLTPLLAIFWRINPDFKTKVKGLMEWCDLDHNSKYCLRELRDLEASLDYMVSKGYMGSWSSDAENKYPSQCSDPLSCCLSLHPPEWLQQEIQAIKDKKESYSIAHQEQTALTLDEFKRIFDSSGLTSNQFANHIGVTRQLVNYILKGTRKITKSTANKVRAFQENQVSRVTEPVKLTTNATPLNH